MQKQIGFVNSWPVIELHVAGVLTGPGGFGLKHDSTRSLRR